MPDATPPLSTNWLSRRMSEAPSTVKTEPTLPVYWELTSVRLDTPRS